MNDFLCIKRTGFEGKKKLFKLINNDKFILSRQINTVLRKDTGQVIHFLYLKEEFIGYAITEEVLTLINKSFMWISLLEISSPYRRKGYGSYFLKSFTFDTLFVDSMLRREGFYKKNGFEIIDTNRMSSIMVRSSDYSYNKNMWMKEMET